MSIQLQVLRATHGRFVNYCYLLLNVTTRKAIAIDPAWNIDLYRNILDRGGYNLTDILVTHHHHDHINLIPALLEIYDSSVWISDIEAEFYNVSFDNLNRFRKPEELLPEAMPATVLMTPGHTIGSCCYLIGDCLFTGDTLFIEGCGVCVGPGADAYVLYDSIQDLKREIDDTVKVYPGHCYGHLPGQTLEFVNNNNIYMQLNNKEHFVKFRNRKNMAFTEFL